MIDTSLVNDTDMINDTDLMRDMLVKVCQKTVNEKYSLLDIDLDFFGTIEGKGMFVKEEYIALAKEYEHVDMRYDLFEWENGEFFQGMRCIFVRQ